MTKRSFYLVGIFIFAIIAALVVFFSPLFRRGAPVSGKDDYRAGFMFNETENVVAVIADFLYDEKEETKDCESFVSFATARDARFRTSDPSAEDDDSFSVYLILPPGRCRLGEGKSVIACTSAIPKGMHAGYRCIIVFENDTLTATFINRNQTMVGDIPIADLPAICPDLFFSPRYFTNRAREKSIITRK